MEPQTPQQGSWKIDIPAIVRDMSGKRPPGTSCLKCSHCPSKPDETTTCKKMGLQVLRDTTGNWLGCFKPRGVPIHHLIALSLMGAAAVAILVFIFVWLTRH